MYIKISYHLMVFIQEIICQKKSEAYVKNLDKYEHWNIGTYWVAIYDENDEVIYFDSFGIEVMSNENIANLYIQQMIQ